MRLLFGFLLFSINTFSQDSSIVKVIEDLPSQQTFDTAHGYKKVEQKYVYIISDNDTYNIFGYEAAVRYRDFNFADYHILGQQINGK